MVAAFPFSVGVFFAAALGTLNPTLHLAEWRDRAASTWHRGCSEKTPV